MKEERNERKNIYSVQLMQKGSLVGIDISPCHSISSPDDVNNGLCYETGAQANNATHRIYLTLNKLLLSPASLVQITAVSYGLTKVCSRFT